MTDYFYVRRIELAAEKIREEIERATRKTIDALEELGKQMAVTTEEIRALGRQLPKREFEFATCVSPQDRERLRLNQRCPLLWPGKLVYGVPHDVTAVYDAGVQIPIDGEYESLLQLVAASIPPGKCALCRGYGVGHGVARLAIVPFGPVTCDGSDMTPEVKNAQDFLEGLGGEQMTVGMSYERHEDRIDAIDHVHDEGRTIYDSGWIKACGRSFMPNVTPGEVVEFKGQRLMVTEINNDLVFFDLVDPEPSDDNPEG